MKEQQRYQEKKILHYLFNVISVFIVYLYFLDNNTFALVIRSSQMLMLYTSLKSQLVRTFFWISLIIATTVPVIFLHCTFRTGFMPLLLNFVGKGNTGSLYTLLLLDIVILLLELILVVNSRLLNGSGGVLNRASMLVYDLMEVNNPLFSV